MSRLKTAYCRDLVRSSGHRPACNVLNPWRFILVSLPSHRSTSFLSWWPLPSLSAVFLFFCLPSPFAYTVLELPAFSPLHDLPSTKSVSLCWKDIFRHWLYLDSNNLNFLFLLFQPRTFTLSMYAGHETLQRSSTLELSQTRISRIPPHNTATFARL